MEDPWGPGCDGHSALSNGDCEEIIDANGDRYIPAAKVVIGDELGIPFYYVETRRPFFSGPHTS